MQDLLDACYGMLIEDTRKNVLTVCLKLNINQPMITWHMADSQQEEHSFWQLVIQLDLDNRYLYG